MLHVLLRFALALSPTSAAIEHLFSLVTVVCPVTRRRMTRETLENRILVARDSPRWQEYDVGPLMRRRKTRSSIRDRPRKDIAGKHDYPKKRRRCGAGARGALSETHVDFTVSGGGAPKKRARLGAQAGQAAAGGK
eukprot:gene12893-6277_t